MLDLAVSRDAMRRATERLARAGRRQPRQDAVRLARDIPSTGDPEAGYHAAVDRLVTGEPYAYVVGWTGFRYLTLTADSRALIPRPETEGLVEGVLARAPGGVAIDVGTGSGCIALSLAQEGRYRTVIGLDLSMDAVRLAEANRRAAGLNVRLMAGSLLDALGDAVADVLVANPPYLTLQEFGALDPAVGVWEPAGALVSGQDGLDATGVLVSRGARVLRPGGLLALEVDCRRAGVVAGAARDEGWLDVEVVRDVFGRDRYVFARKRGVS